MSQRQVHRAHTESETRRIAGELASVLRPGDVIALDGALGAGKTTFVRGLAAALGADERDVSSPTFVISHEYECAHGVLVHIDAYRLTSPEDLESIGWAEPGPGDSDAIVAIEWADRVAGALPATRINVELSHAPDGRIIAIEDRRDA